MAIAGTRHICYRTRIEIPHTNKRRRCKKKQKKTMFHESPSYFCLVVKSHLRISDITIAFAITILTSLCERCMMISKVM